MAKEKTTELVAALIVENSKILLVHNIKKGRRVEPPGGKVKAEESYEDATIRECREELGVEIEIQRKVGIYHTHSPEGNFNVHTFKCRIKSGEPSLKEPQIIDKIEYYSYKELETLKKDGYLVPNLANSLEHIKTIIEEK